MPYTIKPKIRVGFGSFAVLAADGQEALATAKGMMERGIEEVEILDGNGSPCDPSALERTAGQADD
jgi:hypothetical protein